MIKINKQLLEDLLKLYGYSYSKLEKSLNIKKLKEKVEKGNLTFKQIYKIADFFGINVSHFITNTSIEELNLPLIKYRKFKDQNSRTYVKKIIWIKKIIDTIKEYRVDFKSDLSIFKGNLEEDVNIFKKLLKEKIGKKDNYTFNDYKEFIENNFNVLVIIANLKRDIRGFSVFYRDIGLIMINALDDEKKSKFTILHEFYHIVLNFKSKNKESFLVDIKDFLDSLNEKEERLCNKFASSVLISDEQLLKEIKKYKNARLEELIEKLSKKFGVSKSVVILKILESDIKIIRKDKIKELLEKMKNKNVKFNYSKSRKMKEDFGKIKNILLEEYEEGNISFYELMKLFDKNMKETEKMIY